MQVSTLYVYDTLYMYIISNMQYIYRERVSNSNVMTNACESDGMDFALTCKEVGIYLTNPDDPCRQI